MERNTTSTDWWRTEVGSPPPGCQGGARATQAFGIKKFFRQKKWTMDTHSWPDTVSDNPLISEPPEISWLTLKKPQSYTSLCDLPLGVRSLRKSRPCLDFVCHNRLTRLLAISEDNLWIRTLRKVLNFQQSSVKLRLENSSCWQNVFLLKSTICSYLFAKNGDEFNFRQIFWGKDHFSQKYQIRNCRLECTQCPFKPSLWFCKMCKKNKKLKQNSFQVTTDAFQASIGKHASCRNRNKEQNLPKSVFRWQIFDHLVTMMTNLHWFLWCWRCCPFASSVIWEDRLDALSARRATIADVTSTNWTKKGDFRRNYPLFDNCYCHIDTSEFQISGSSSVFSWHCLPLYTAQCADLYLLLLFFIPCLPTTVLFAGVYISPSTEYIHVCSLVRSSYTSQFGSLCSYPENSWRKVAFLPFHTET